MPCPRTSRRTWLLAAWAPAMGCLGHGIETERKKMNPADFFTDPKALEAARAIEGDDTARLRSLAREGLNLNVKGKDGMTLVLWALGRTRKSSLRALLELGADANSASADGTTPVSLAAGAKDPEYLQILLQGRVSPNALNHLGEPALFEALDRQLWDNFDLLLKHGADINASSRAGQTSILRLATLNEWEQVARLMQRGADYSLPDGNGATVAWRVQTKKINPNSPQAQWRDKVKQMLEQRGVRFPVPRPEQRPDRVRD